MCSRGTLLSSLNSSIVFPYSFLSFTPNIFEPEGICFGAPTSLSPTFFDNGEDVFCNYLHAMGGVHKEGLLRYFCMKVSFRWLKNLTSGTFGWMLEHSSHCAVIVADNDINDKEVIIEGILYHLNNSRSLHTFWASLKVLWELMVLCSFYYILCRVTLPAGLWIDDHSYDPLTPSTDDEGVYAGGVISPPRWSILPAHVVCHGKFNLVVVFPLVR